MLFTVKADHQKGVKESGSPRKTARIRPQPGGSVRVATSRVTFAFAPHLRVLCCWRRKLTEWKLGTVRAPFWRLYWNDRPGATLFSEVARYEIEPARFTLVAPNTTLISEFSGPIVHYYAHFTVGLPFAHVQNHVHRFPARPELVQIMKRSFPPYEKNDTDTPERLAAVMSLCWSALQTLPRPLLAVTTSEPRLNELLHWWESEEWRAVSNKELAVRMHMGTEAFCRLFSHLIGQSPHAYGLSKRIGRACMLLRYTTQSIEQIAEETGFCDRFHFSRIFKQVQKTTPAAFRHNRGHT